MRHIWEIVVYLVYNYFHKHGTFLMMKFHSNNHEKKIGMRKDNEIYQSKQDNIFINNNNKK